MARETGLEPATSGVTGRHSNQLSYSRSGPIRSIRERRDLKEPTIQVKDITDVPLYRTFFHH